MAKQHPGASADQIERALSGAGGDRGRAGEVLSVLRTAPNSGRRSLLALSAEFPSCRPAAILGALEAAANDRDRARRGLAQIELFHATHAPADEIARVLDRAGGDINTAREVLIRRMLTQKQTEALRHVAAAAKAKHVAALPGLVKRAVLLGKSEADVESTLAYIKEDVPLVIHFSEECLRTLCDDPFYRSQFETGTSGGTNDRVSRTLWEQRMFPSYDESTRDGERVKYGCVNLTDDVKGVAAASSSYGSFFMVLTRECRHRATIADTDTGSSSAVLGTSDWFGHIMASFNDRTLKSALSLPCPNSASLSHIFDDTRYREIQIHGEVSIAHDVAALHVPCSSKSVLAETRELIKRFSEIAQCAVKWQLN
ncbi:hypothetical protein TeGR_g15036 [Tetraparma gracilis]|uniref:Uncharacterized protein n=1 Tax=Tetraparma gracilis TaxID=2962635 RepID=A0ABQ6M8C3_9STRA|nr:hypothetical protein TeGR_g15036 [Tetraparma gracilis]